MGLTVFIRETRPPIFRGIAAAVLAVLALAVPEALSASALTAAQAQEPRQLRLIPRLSGPIVFDGLITEKVWDEIQPLPMTMLFPNPGQAPTERTEVFIGFDEEYLWVAGRLFDREPAKIQSNSKKRDYSSADTDWLAVSFDTFNDKENFLTLFTNPAGLRSDMAVSNDAVQKTSTTSPLNMSWNTFWDVKTSRDERGWYAEVRIPLSSLRFQDRGGRVVMGLLVWRWIPHKNELQTFPEVDPKWGDYAMYKPSQAYEVVLEGVRGRKPLYIAPYILGGYGQDFALNEAETAYVRENKPAHEAGLDVKYGLTSNLTLDLTVNTDFAQVEADDYQVNLTRFSLFFPEKRPFFQERASVFDFAFDDLDSLFYSRRIGIYDGRAVRIFGGTRLVGRVGPWDVGFLDMQTAPVEDLSSENDGVLRLRRQVFNSYSYVGAMATTRIGTHGSYNTAYGLDGIFRVSGEHYFSFNWAQTFADGEPNRAASLDSARYKFGWEKRSKQGLGFNLSLSRSGEDFNPGLGFQMREDFTRFGNRVLYGWIPGQASFLNSHNIFADGTIFWRNADHSVESAALGPGWHFFTKSAYMGEFAFKVYRESVRESFSLSEETDVPPGEYTFYGLTGYLQTNMGKPLGAQLYLDAGSFYDGWRTSLTLMPSWSLSSVFNLSAVYEFDHVEFPDRHQVFTAHLVRLRLLATFTTALSASAFVQYSGAAHGVIANVRLRYNPREGNDFYIVINENFNTDREREVPFRPAASSRAILLKYSYTFNF